MVVASPLDRVRAEHAVGAAVATGDRRSDAADDRLVAQRVPGNRVSVVKSSMTTGTRPACSPHAIPVRLDISRSSWRPAIRRRHATAAWRRPAPLSKKMFTSSTSRISATVRTSSSKNLGRSVSASAPFAEPRDRILLACAYADLAIEQALGDRMREHLHGRAVLDDDGRRDLEPAFLASRRRGPGNIEAAWRERAHAFLDGRNDARLVLRMQVVGAEGKHTVPSCCSWRACLRGWSTRPCGCSGCPMPSWPASSAAQNAFKRCASEAAPSFSQRWCLPCFRRSAGYCIPGTAASMGRPGQDVPMGGFRRPSLSPADGLADKIPRGVLTRIVLCRPVEVKLRRASARCGTPRVPARSNVY